MLCELRVKDLLLFDQLEIRLEPGFNVMTGETGGGKSVVVGALKLVLGGRALPTQIRPGAAEAEVEALFDVADSSDAAACLRDAGIDHDDELVIRRVIQSSSRSRAYRNGRLCTAAELAELGPLLADIASQHESVSLTDVSTHLGYLDAFGGLDEDRKAVAELVLKLQEVRKKLAQLREAARDRAEREAFLKFQLGAIEDLAPEPGELDSLRSERTRLRSASRLADVAGGAAHRLVDGEPALCDELQRIAGELSAVVDLDPELEDTLGIVQEAVTNLRDAGRALERYAERIEANPGRLDEVEERLFRYEQLMRLHGPTEDDVLAARDRIRAELDGLDRIDDELASLEASFDDQLAQAGALAFVLSERRQAVAGSLATAIGDELAALGMGGARVQVDVAQHEGGRGELEVRGARLSVDGVDKVEFLIAPNKGIAPRPLRKIASGGELSRSLLAIKRVLAAKGPAGLYVFDEVDTGVGGAVAERIGQALADIARHRQVLCITHLAPIAALADAHYVVHKSQNGAVAKTEIRRVTGKERVRELARMLSGVKVTKASLETAEEMLRARR